MKANQRVPAPRGRRTHSFGSTWRWSRGKLLLWMFYNQTIAFADAGIGKCRLRRHSRPSYTWSHVLSWRNNSADNRGNAESRSVPVPSLAKHLGRKPMWKKLILVLVVCVLTPRLGNGQDAKAVLDGVAKSMGEVKSLQYAGSGANYSFGQDVSPGTPWPRFNLKSYTRTLDYDTPAMRDEFVRTQADPGARGGGGIPLVGEQRQLQAVSGTQAWNQVGDAIPTAQLAAVNDRLHQLWITPHGVIKAAMKHNATVEPQTEPGKKLTIISFAVPGQVKVKAFVDERNLVEKVASWNTNPVLGDVLTETIYADYKDFGGVQFPTKNHAETSGIPYP
jgi:hypothetical protein